MYEGIVGNLVLGQEPGLACVRERRGRRNVVDGCIVWCCKSDMGVEKLVWGLESWNCVLVCVRVCVYVV